MNKLLIALSSAAIAVSAIPASAQSVPGSTLLVGAVTPAVLRAGTQVPLKMSEALTTKGKSL